MIYKDLNELTIKEWDGKPIECYYIDDEDIPYYPHTKQDRSTHLFTGYMDGRWHWNSDDSDPCYAWKHVYPVEWNKDLVNTRSKNRMTNEQLAIWLKSSPHHYMVTESNIVKSYYDYNIDDTDKPVPNGIRVRYNDEWLEPTYSVFIGDC